MLKEHVWVKCKKDGFNRIGTTFDFDDLVKVGECQGCTGFRYKCPNCGTILKGRKIDVEVPDPPKE